MPYPIERERRSPYHGPLPSPGQTVMGCPICKKRAVFSFTEDNKLRCEKCGFIVSREEAT